MKNCPNLFFNHLLLQSMYFPATTMYVLLYIQFAPRTFTPTKITTVLQIPSYKLLSTFHLYLEETTYTVCSSNAAKSQILPHMECFRSNGHLSRLVWWSRHTAVSVCGEGQLMLIRSAPVRPAVKPTGSWESQYGGSLIVLYLWLGG